MQALIQDLNRDSNWNGILLLNSWYEILQDSFVFEEAMRLLSLEQQVTVLRKKSHLDKCKALCNRLLQLAGISMATGLHYAQLQFQVGPCGKPQYKGIDEIYFSMSNGERYVGQYISKSKFNGVGIDLASISDYSGDQDLVNFKEIFSSQEFDSLLQCSLSKRAPMFAYIWSLKECYTKYTGMGLNSELSKIDFGKVNLFENETTIKRAIDRTEMWFHSKWIKPNEIATVCHESSAGRDQNPQLYHVTLQEVLNQLRETHS